MYTIYKCKKKYVIKFIKYYFLTRAKICNSFNQKVCRFFALFYNKKCHNFFVAYLLKLKIIILFLINSINLCKNIKFILDFLEYLTKYYIFFVHLFYFDYIFLLHFVGLFSLGLYILFQ